MVYRSAKRSANKIRERIEDDGKALTYLNLFADLGGEFEG
jgi:hypothetical protein